MSWHRWLCVPRPPAPCPRPRAHGLKVRSLLAGARDMERLLGAVPELLDAKALVSVLTTVRKWYHLEKDPVEALEADPEMVQRAQVRERACCACCVPPNDIGRYAQ